MQKIKSLNIVFLALVLTVFGCAQNEPETSITVDQLKQEMKTNKNLIVLDVRTEPELSGPLGKIDGVLNIPVQELEERYHELDKYKDKEIAVICRSGNRSKLGTAILKEHGFKVKNVLGGMIAYRKSEQEN